MSALDGGGLISEIPKRKREKRKNPEEKKGPEGFGGPEAFRALFLFLHC